MDEQNPASSAGEKVCFVCRQQVTLSFARDVATPKLGKTGLLCNKIEQSRLTIDGCESCVAGRVETTPQYVFMCFPLSDDLFHRLR